MDMTIPSMMIQLFVENAVLHGVGPKDEDGIIEINFAMKESALVCSVTDNGVGREAVTANDKDHQSLGMKIVQKRINAINQIENQQMAFDVEDLKDEQGIATGTKVNITFRKRSTFEA